MVAPSYHHPTHDRTREWHACCHEVILGRDPKRQRLDFEDEDTDDDDDELFHTFAAPGNLAIDMLDSKKKVTKNLDAIGDSWMEAAVAMSASIDEVSTMIQSKAASYVSSSDTFHICFHDRGNFSENFDHEMSNSDRSILETTVASFAAGMAKQIDSLRQAVVVEGDHPFLNFSHQNESNERTSTHWATGPIGHRAGIASCLMQRLKSEIMDPMTDLQRQRERKFKNNGNFSMEDASKIAQNPLLGFHSKAEEMNQRSLPPAPWEIGEHDSKQNRLEHDQERDEFLSVYYDETPQEETEPLSLEALRRYTRPSSAVLQWIDLPKSTTLRQPNATTEGVMVDRNLSEGKQSSAFSFMATKPAHNPTDDYLMSTYREEEAIEQLQRESAALIATYQHSDLEGVQKVERSMVEITQLLSRFTDLITEQQEDIFMIHDQAMKSKENVDKGQSQLVDAARRGEKSKHPMASFIVVLAFLLLFFNWILP
ncbi:hypothetical protein ACHAW6_008199 [Cyclotella cf. meneghiniana]